MFAPVTDVRVLTSVSDMTADSGRARIVEHSRQASCHAKQGFSQQHRASASVSKLPSSHEAAHDVPVGPFTLCLMQYMWKARVVFDQSGAGSGWCKERLPLMSDESVMPEILVIVLFQAKCRVVVSAREGIPRNAKEFAGLAVGSRNNTK
ncbi:uncharacterized protein K489DRAFT_371904 [Dissoconium aciculare CBS 342.82]|uniref:Uncharacterized protein n=1 Tax=Dissoconium aciculare CBS 342.82 TaxID=1314786 RepID=A0A6J3LYU1_9PEZI|nr:uncharacterized protein K489DRAFT_371904 [Dissoconium aciculare CBS 342.82]KAF1820940.1 hypothetical protein K489DRAFT_371904 [Dissoconium aciculare CBS 342.82]